MSHDAFHPSRRRILTAAASGAVLGGAGILRPAFAQAKEFKIGFFIALSGPAALFGPTQKACAELAAEKINKAAASSAVRSSCCSPMRAGRRPRPRSRRCA